jgi:hypothetical protein
MDCEVRGHGSQGEVSRDFFGEMLCIQTEQGEQGENEDSARAETVLADRLCVPQPL